MAVDEGRKPTPCTVPVTRIRSLVVASAATAQQMRGSGSPTSMSTIRVPPKLVSSTTMASGSATISPIRAASAPSGCARSAASAASASSGATTATHLALVGDVQRVDAEQVARAHDRRCDRQQRLVEHDREVGVAREFVAHRGDTAARRIAHPARRRCGLSKRFDELAERRRVGADVGVEHRGRRGRASPPCRDRRSLPDSSTTSPGRTCSGPSWRPAGSTPTPAVVMYRPSAAPLPTTFVSPVTSVTPAAAAAAAMSATISRSSAIGEALLDHECGREPQRLRAGRQRGR